MRPLAALGVLLLALGASQCSKGSPTTPTPSGGIQPPPLGRTAVLVGAGDIGQCGSRGTPLTGRMIESTLGDVFLAGDIAYFDGSAANFRDCFDPFWGHARGRWHPVPGNHEYNTPGAAPYFDYFGPSAGPRALGYYSFTAGDWLVLMLNSNVPAGRGTPQFEFARQTLESRPSKCQMAIWHHPLFSSSQNGPQLFMREMFELMQQNAVDVVVNGHDHVYERFSRQDATGRQDENGVRQFIVGTGGADLYPFVTAAPNSGARISAFGVIRFTLRPDTYEWEFIETTGAISDNGSTPCH